jgi:hypothetical protein
VLEALCRCFSPFLAMKDVNRGTLEQRTAAHRHNRRMRGALSGCMLRWAASCTVALALTAYFEGLGRPGTAGLHELLAAACATFCACSLCVLFISAYVYVHLAHDR